MPGCLMMREKVVGGDMRLYRIIFVWLCIIACNVGDALWAQSEGDYIAGKVVVKLKPHSTKDYSLTAAVRAQELASNTCNTIKLMRQQCFLEELPPARTTTSRRRAPQQAFPTDWALIYILDIDPNLPLAMVLNSLHQDPAVQYAEPLYKHYPLIQLPPNDPLIGSQYYLDNIRALQAWQLPAGQGDASVIVGVVDNGFDLTHPDLANQFVPGYDLANNDANPQAPFNHGTAVAGVGFAQVNNAIGIAGVGYQCRFMPLKVAPDSDQNNYVAAYAGVIYAAQNGCKVINMSWGRRGNPSQFEQDLLQSLVGQYDVVLVAAAGNDGDEGYFYPASYAQVLSVGGSNVDDERWSGSNFNDKVSLLAPGESVFTTLISNNYAVVSGTSFAAPQVAAAAALVRSKYPTLNALEVRALLMGTARTVSAQSVANQTGKLGTGVLDVAAALSQTPDFIHLQSAWLGFNNQGQWVLRAALKSVSALSNLQVAFICDSAFVQPIQSNISLGNVAAGADILLPADGLRFVLGSTPAPNSQTMFGLQFSADGAFSQTIYVRLNINPTNYLNFSVNQVSMGLNNVSALGRADYLNNFDPLPFTYRGQALFTEAGLVLGRSATQVSDALRAEPATLRNEAFTALNPAIVMPGTALDTKVVEALYTDIPNNIARSEVEVKQQVFAWSGGGADKYVIVEYRVRNLSPVTFPTLRVGLYADWNIQSITQNRSLWDAERRMAYAFDQPHQNLYGGLRLLTDQPNVLYAFDTDGAEGSLNIDDGFSLSEKWTALNNARNTAGGAGGNDIAQLLSVGINNLEPGQTSIVAFALLAGDNLTDLQMVADTALGRYQQARRSPVPNIDTLIMVCVGTSLNLSPTNGSRFRFYTQLPPASPLATGKTLFINNLKTAQTYYITNIDSLYESTPIRVRIVPLPYTHTMVAPDTFDLSSGQPLHLVAESAEAVSFLWDFGNGQTAPVAQPLPPNYVPGTYTLQLTTQNAQGCRHTSTKTLVVLDCANSRASFIADPPFLDLRTGQTAIFRGTTPQAAAWFWNLGAGQTSTAAQASRSFVFAGIYPIYLQTITPNGCRTDTTLMYEVRDRDPLTSIEQRLEEELRIYPNPSQGQVWVEIPELPQTYEWILYRIDGTAFATQTSQGGAAGVWYWERLPKGTYVLLIRWPEGQWVQKLMVR